MTLLSEMLAGAVESDFVRHGSGLAVVEGVGDDWMSMAIRQVQAVAARHTAHLKKETGRGWKLFKHFLTDNGRLIVRFDLARRQDITQDPMIVLRIAYSASADLYDVQVEVWKSASEKLAADETDSVDVEMLADPVRVYFGVGKALRQLDPRKTESAGSRAFDRVVQLVMDEAGLPEGDALEVAAMAMTEFVDPLSVGAAVAAGWAGSYALRKGVRKTLNVPDHDDFALPEKVIAKAVKKYGQKAMAAARKGWKMMKGENASISADLESAITERHDPTSLPASRRDFVPWDSLLRHRDTGKIMVPAADDLARDLQRELGSIRWTRDLKTRVASGAISVYADNDTSEVVALVGIVGAAGAKPHVGFLSAPEEPDEKVNEGVRSALDQAMKRFRPWDSQGESMSNLSSELAKAITEKGETPEQLARMQRGSAFSKRAGDTEGKKHGKAPEEPKKGGGVGGAIKRGMKMVFGKWAKVEGDEADGPDVVPFVEALIGTSGDTLGLQAALVEKGETPEQLARMQRNTSFSKKAGDTETKKHGKAPEEKKPGGIGGALKKGMKMVFGKWAKTEDGETGEGVYPLDERFLDTEKPLDDAYRAANLPEESLYDLWLNGVPVRFADLKKDPKYVAQFGLSEGVDGDSLGLQAALLDEETGAEGRAKAAAYAAGTFVVQSGDEKREVKGAKAAREAAKEWSAKTGKTVIVKDPDGKVISTASSVHPSKSLQRESAAGWSVLDEARQGVVFDPVKGKVISGPMPMADAINHAAGMDWGEVYDADTKKIVTAYKHKKLYKGYDPDTKLNETRLGFTVDMGGPGGDRTNPTKSGPAAERANTLKSARAGIERMLQAIETVRGWVKNLGLGDKDKTGAAAAALKAAAAEISKVENVQGVLSTMFELPALHPGAATVLDEAIQFVEKRAEQSAEAVKAKDGLARMVDGLRQLHGMLRQAKLTGRVLDQVEAAINGLKATRDAIDALAECGPMPTGDGEHTSETYPPGGLYSRFERTAASKIRKGDWVMGGGSGVDQMYRRVARIERQEDDMQYVILHFGAPYKGADGINRVTARFHKDALVKSARA